VARSNAGTGHNQVLHIGNPETTDPLYLLPARWSGNEALTPRAAWEVISAARSLHQDTRAHALFLLERSQETRSQLSEGGSSEAQERRSSTREAAMRTPYGLEIIESCMGCKASREGFFCRFSPARSKVGGRSQPSQRNAARSAAVRGGANAAWRIHSLLRQGEALDHLEGRQGADPETGGSR
jgi:hypothetical protein